MHLILTGATGLVGSACLHRMLVNETITKVSVLSRRPVPQASGHAKVNVILHKDFKEYPENILQQIQGATGCVWALGVSQNDVSKDLYEEITYAYTLAAAKAFSTLASDFNFVYVSGEGATTSPGAFTPFFGRVKGRTEADLLALSKQAGTTSLHVYSVRPGVVDAKFHTEIHPWVPAPKFVPRVISALGVVAALRGVAPGMVAPTRELGDVLVRLAAGDGEPVVEKGVDGEGRTVANGGVREMAGI